MLVTGGASAGACGDAAFGLNGIGASERAAAFVLRARGDPAAFTGSDGFVGAMSLTVSFQEFRLNRMSAVFAYLRLDTYYADRSEPLSRRTGSVPRPHVAGDIGNFACVLISVS
jgi:hypothetical protein